jgi:uncharacterized protein (DUF2236 family)
MADRVVEVVRAGIAAAVRDRVVGPDVDARATAFMTASGARWFDEDRPIHVVHADAAMFVGGLRALLLQSLHPLAMAGVAQHSDYRNDPWGRLQRTASFLAATTFGDAEQAREAIARVRSVHQRVRGTSADGRAYDANDPHLLRWVHVAEVDSFLAAHGRYGQHSLDQAGRDGYVADMAVIARALGVPAPPTTERALRDAIRVFRRELVGTPEAREAARYLLFDPPVPMLARPAYAVLGAAAVSLLPLWARWPLRLPAFPIAERLAWQPAGDALTRTLRWALSAP